MLLLATSATATAANKYLKSCPLARKVSPELSHFFSTGLADLLIYFYCNLFCWSLQNKTQSLWSSSIWKCVENLCVNANRKLQNQKFLVLEFGIFKDVNENRHCLKFNVNYNKICTSLAASLCWTLQVHCSHTAFAACSSSCLTFAAAVCWCFP